MFNWIKNALNRKKGGAESRAPAAPPDPEAIARVKAATRKAIIFNECDDETNTFTGGIPNLGSRFDWPCKDGTPLEFMGQVDLADMAQLLPDSPLPKTGILSFFYAMQSGQAWGFDPKDAGCWKVIHSEPGEPSLVPNGVEDIPRLNLRGHVADSFATHAHDAYKGIPGLETLEPHWESIFPVAEHSELQILGFAAPIQSDMMEEECSMASSGIFAGDGRFWNSPEAVEARERATEWVLLAQFNSRESQDILFGDVGMLYYFIKLEDLERGDFSQSWISLQCY